MQNTLDSQLAKDLFAYGFSFDKIAREFTLQNRWCEFTLIKNKDEDFWRVCGVSIDGFIFPKTIEDVRLLVKALFQQNLELRTEDELMEYELDGDSEVQPLIAYTRELIAKQND